MIWKDEYKEFLEGLMGERAAEKEVEYFDSIIGNLGEVGEAAVKCLERNSSDDMVEVAGMQVLMEEIFNMCEPVHGKIVLRQE